MPIWRCPHCGTPQAETSRCWVCRRSSTTCSTCRHFRRSLAANVGFCGIDPKRLPLTGLERRGCWEEGPARAHDAFSIAPADAEPEGPVPELGAPGPAPDAAILRLLDFVPVELRADRARARHEALAERRRAARDAEAA